jgi:radical SAM protein with 4Fe4S-binding SPASM domain
VHGLSDRGHTVAIRCNVDKRNADHINRLIDYVEMRGWHKKVELYFVAVHSWGLSNSNARLDNEEFAALEAEWLQRMAASGFLVTPLPKRKPLVCRVVSMNHTVIGHNGYVHKCSESPLTPYNKQNDTVGKVQDGDFLAADRIWPWHKQVLSEQYPCTKCRFFPTCGGGCPLSWQRESDVPCPSYKYNIEQRIAVFRSMAHTAHISNGVQGATSEFSPIRYLSETTCTSENEWRTSFIGSVQSSLAHARKGHLAVARKLLHSSHIAHSHHIRRDALYFISEATLNAAESYLYYKEAHYPESIEALFFSIKQMSNASRFDSSICVIPAQIQMAINIAKVLSLYDQDECQRASMLIKDHLDGCAHLRLRTVLLPRTDYSKSKWSGELPQFRNSIDSLLVR